jgi:hypothetical protein
MLVITTILVLTLEKTLGTSHTTQRQKKREEKKHHRQRKNNIFCDVMLGRLQTCFVFLATIDVSSILIPIHSPLTNTIV